MVSLIFRTQRHFAKSAPSFLYWAQRSDRPSRPGTKHKHTLQNRGSVSTGFTDNASFSYRSLQGARGQVLSPVSTYPGLWSLHWFLPEGQHPCQPRDGRHSRLTTELKNIHTKYHCNGSASSTGILFAVYLCWFIIVIKLCHLLHLALLKSCVQ